MKQKHIYLLHTFMIVLFVVLIFTIGFPNMLPINVNWLRTYREQIVLSVTSPQFLDYAVTFLLAYLFVFTGLRARMFRRQLNFSWKREMTRSSCLLLFAAGVAVCYWCSGSVHSSDAVLIVFSLTIAQGIVLIDLHSRTYFPHVKIANILINVLIVCLSVTVFIQPKWGEGIMYHSKMRWQGPCLNPNHFGLLMGVGLVLAVGQTMLMLRRSDLTYYFRRNLWPIVYVLSASLLGLGLIKSYSRAAWLATSCALAYLTYRNAQSWRIGRRGHILTNREYLLSRRTFKLRHSSLVLASMLAIVTSIWLISFWNLRESNHLPIRRLLSIGNVNDFSWRNRVTAYEGALQLMASRPFNGFGWDRPIIVYEKLYRPAKINEGVVIQLNDVFMIGMVLGVPILVCFVAFISLSLDKHCEPYRLSKAKQDLTCYRQGFSHESICVAAVVTLLIGFWLGRGLFFLPFAVLFFTFLELGYIAVSEEVRGCAVRSQPKWASNS